LEDVVCYVLEPSTIANVLASSASTMTAFWRDIAHSMSDTLILMWQGNNNDVRYEYVGMFCCVVF
jgi:hypothetical protein